MSKPLATVPADAFVYHAIARMSRLKIRHLGAVDDDGAIVGALTARDLLRLRAGEAISLGDEIDQAGDAHALAVAWAKLPHVAGALLAEGLAARDIAAVISREIGALTRQAAVLAERRMRADGNGDPPCPYAVAVLGSAGRGESLLAMDQDNALFFTQGEPDGCEDRWFGALGAEINDILNEAGVSYCKGGVMARNPLWRGSVATWHARIGDWIRRSNPNDLLSVDIFFDLRGVHGDASLANRLQEDAFDAADGQRAFAKLLTEPPARSSQVLPSSVDFAPRMAVSISREPDYLASSPRRAPWPSAIMWWSVRRRRGSPASRRSVSAADTILTRSLRPRASSSICYSISRSRTWNTACPRRMLWP